MRSFSNLWFWIALAVMWSSSSHWVLGVPFDMVTRAKRQGNQAEVDLIDITRVNVNRLMYIGQVAGLWLAGIVCFALTVLGVLGFWYDVEFAQALFLLSFPMSLVGVLSLRAAALIERHAQDAEDLCKRLSRHRLVTQIIGTFSIFVTVIWGMHRNFSIGVLGN